LINKKYKQCQQAWCRPAKSKQEHFIRHSFNKLYNHGYFATPISGSYQTCRKSDSNKGLKFVYNQFPLFIIGTILYICKGALHFG